MRSELIKQFFVESAHANARGDERATRMHGHSYRIDIVLEGEVDPRMGWVVDFGDIKKAFGPLHEAMDHNALNAIEGLTDLAVEGVREWVFAQLRDSVPGLRDVRVRILGDLAYQPIFLNPDPWQGLPGRIGFSFEAAHHLPMTPANHKCHRLHGHSYRVEVIALTLDGLIEHLRAVYAQLDHQCLNDLPGLENATSEILAQWIWNKLSPSVKDLRAVIVQETCTARCVYYGT